MAETLSRITRCRLLPGNVHGRDLVVGDIHGHRCLLEKKLVQLNFDPARDRVFSVGDLINRGPDSLGSLSLIDEPWFHAVLGNHELMLLNFLGYYSSRVHCSKTFSTGGGEWIIEALSRHRKTVRRLADQLAALPLAIHVDANCPFNVMHGDLMPLNYTSSTWVGQETVSVHEADSSTASRANFREAVRCDLLDLKFGEHPVQISEAAVGELPMIYVGHSPVRNVLVHNSYIYIDQGVCARLAGRPDTERQLTLMDHSQFSRWLQGVVSARGQGAAPKASAGGRRADLAACE